MELSAQGIGRLEIEILLRDSVAYLPVIQTLNFLGVKASYDSTSQRIQGFYKNPDNEFTIDMREGTARIGSHALTMNPEDFVLTETEQYIRIGFLNDMYDLDFKYNPRSVSVTLHKTRDLPAFVAAGRHRMMLHQQRIAIPEPSVEYGRDLSLVGAGRLDWSASTRFTELDEATSRYSLNLGMQAFGGDFTGSLVGFSEPHMHQNDYRGQLRYPIFDFPPLRQIIIGDFVSGGIQPELLTGFEVTNRPFVQRVFFSKEVFHGLYEPNADIELSAAALGRKFLQTDETGGYEFDYPVLYGQGRLDVKSYDPWGQVIVSHYRMNVPRTLLPAGEFEYSISGGRLRPPMNTLSSSNYVKWGVSSELTVGATLDYYDMAQAPTKFYGGINATSILLRGLAFNGSVAPSAFSQASLDWIFPSNAELTLTGTHLSRNDFFNPLHKINDLYAAGHLPFGSNGSTLFAADMSVDQSEYEGYRQRELQASLTGYFLIFSPRYSSEFAWRQDDGTGSTATLTRLSIASLGVFLPAGVFLESEVDYDHRLESVQSIRGDIVKRLPNSLLIDISYLRYPNLELYNIGLRVEYFFPFARAEATATTSGDSRYVYAAMGSGSVSFDPTTPAVYAENTPSYVGFAGAVLHPFLDVNGNGILDKGEEKIDKGRIYVVNVTRTYQSNFLPSLLAGDKMTMNRIPGYEEFDVYLDPLSLDNPVWVPENATLRFLSEPNYVRRIDIPVVSGGSVHGTITVNDGTARPAEGIKVMMTPLLEGDSFKRKYVRRMNTFSTGEFEFDQVVPGRYQIELDATQLRSLGFSAQPSIRQIEIVVKPEGDAVNNVDFTLSAK